MDNMRPKVGLALAILSFLLIVVIVAGCGRDSAEKMRYEMEKLTFQARKISENINIQPQLATSADSLALRTAYRNVLDYYFAHRNDPGVAENDSLNLEINRLALQAQIQTARLYMAARKPDSAIADYRRVGVDIPVSGLDAINAGLELALAYRATEQYDSTLAVYDRLQEQFYPPVYGKDQISYDIAAIPIDRIKIVQAVKDKAALDRSIQRALDYYARLQKDFSDDSRLSRIARANTTRVYTMTRQWDKAVAELQHVTDSTGAVDVSALFTMANIYAGPKGQPKKAIQLFHEVIDRNPDSAIIGNSMLRLGAALCADKQYDEGRKVLADAKKKFEAYPNVAMPAQYYYAQSFDAEGRWDRALSEFQWLMENYPYAQESFRAALYIPRHFAREGKDKLTGIWYDRAEQFFLDAARVRQGDPVEAQAYTYLADLYRMEGKWNKAIDVLEKIYAIAPRTKVGAQALYFAAAVSYQHLDDSAKAQSYLDQIKRDFGTTDSTLVLEEEKSDVELNP
jgi:tetratricopeptide (TPR) repeat protein